jgi:hypothetical protein
MAAAPGAEIRVAFGTEVSTLTIFVVLVGEPLGFQLASSNQSSEAPPIQSFVV